MYIYIYTYTLAKAVTCILKLNLKPYVTYLISKPLSIKTLRFSRT